MTALDMTSVFEGSTASTGTRPRAVAKIKAKTSKAGNQYVEIRKRQYCLMFGGESGCLDMFEAGMALISAALQPSIREWMGSEDVPALAVARLGDVSAPAALPPEPVGDTAVDALDLQSLTGGERAKLAAILAAAGMTVKDTAPAPIPPGSGLIGKGLTVAVTGRDGQFTVEAVRTSPVGVEYQCKPVGRPAGQRRWYHASRVARA